MAEYEKEYRKARVSRRTSTGAAVLAGLLIISEMAILFSKPAIGLAGHVYYISQGIAAFALLGGGLFWALTEMFTKAGHSTIGLILRFAVSFIIGALIGGVFGAVSNFGRLVLVPVEAGNPLAIFMAIGYLFLFACIAATAAYLHGINSIGRLKGGQ